MFFFLMSGDGMSAFLVPVERCGGILGYHLTGVINWIAAVYSVYEAHV